MKKFSLISLYILFQILGFFRLFEIIVKSSKNENLNKKETQLNYKEWDKEEEEEKNKYFKLLLQNYDQKIQNRPQKIIDPDLEKYKRHMKEKIMGRAVQQR
jgi:hypothetical protein